MPHKIKIIHYSWPTLKVKWTCGIVTGVSEFAVEWNENRKYNTDTFRKFQNPIEQP